MGRLHWELRDLVINAFRLGDAGTEGDIRGHLDDGNPLNASQRLVLVATLNDALLAVGEHIRVA